MKNSSIKLVALLFILLFSLSPLNAIDLNQCDNATYINCTDMKKDSNVIEINDTIKDNDSDVEIKCINENGNFKNNVGYINQSLNDSNSSKNLKSIDSQVLLCTSIKDVDYGQKPVCKIYIPGGDDFDKINVKVTIQNLNGSGDDYKEYTLSARHRNKFEMKFDDDLKPGRYKLKGKLTVLYPKIGPDGKKHSYTLNSYDYNNFTVRKLKTSLNPHIENFNSGKKPVIKFNCKDNLKGNIIISSPSFSKTYKIPASKGSFKYKLDENLTSGTYKYRVSYSDDIYDAQPFTGNFTVYKHNPNLNRTINHFNKDKNGASSHVQYRYKISSDDDSICRSSTASTTFAVKEKDDQNLSIKVDNITEGQKAIVEITANNSLSGKAEIRLNTSSTSYPVEIINCTANTTIDENLTPGEYNATVKLQGNNSLKPTEKSTTFTVKEKEDQNLSIKVDNITEGQKAIVEITANNNLSGKAEIRLNNSSTSYPVEIINGTANTTIDENLTPGEYNATVYFQGDTTDWAGYNSGSSSGDVAIVGDDAIQIGNSLASKYGFRAGVGSETYESMKKRGYGSCWAWSDALFTELTARGYTCRIVEYPTSMASNHRSVQIKKDNHWKDYPYKKTKIDKLAWATRGSFKGTVVR